MSEERTQPRWVEYLPLDDIVYTPENPKLHDADGIAASVDRQGYVDPVIVDERTGLLVSGHGRCDDLKARRTDGNPPPDGILTDGTGTWLVPVYRGWASKNDADARAYVIGANALPPAGGWVEDTLTDWLVGLASEPSGLDGTGFTDDALAELLARRPLPDGGEGGGGGDGGGGPSTPTLADRFLVPPFTILDARQGWWQDRKRMWISTGIQSEVGRGYDLTWQGDAVTEPGLNYYRNRNKSGVLFHAPGIEPIIRRVTDIPEGGPVWDRVRADLARAVKAAGVTRKQVDEWCGTTGMAGHWLGNAQPQIPTPEHWATLAEHLELDPDLWEVMTAVEEVEPSETVRRPDGTTGAYDPRYEKGVDAETRRKQNKVASFQNQDKLAAIQGGRRLTYGAGDRDPDDLDDTSQRILAQGPAAGSGTSIFDPVLTEIVYRWFVPPHGRILDPFAGGSVRGIVAARTGHRYTGIELRPEQVAANVHQVNTLLAGAVVSEPTVIADNTPDVTPIEAHGELWFKRDDLYAFGGSRGGKVRTCLAIARGNPDEPPPVGLVTGGSRQSPQVNIVAGVAAALGIGCRAYTPHGDWTPEMAAAAAHGADIVQREGGYAPNLAIWAHDDAAETGWREVPFGMECDAAVEANAAQVVDIPDGVQRIVIPVGSGMTLAGILHGLRRGGYTIPVLGVVVGGAAEERLDKWAPDGWRDMVTLVESDLEYHDRAPVTVIDGVEVDPIYEAKCLPYLEPGDLFWIVGRRGTAEPPTTSPAPLPVYITGDAAAVLADPDDPVGDGYDLILTCPPYADLEVYSDDPADLSNMDYPAFLESYRTIIAAAVDRLAPNRYAVVVIGEARGRDGNYYGLVPDTIAAFRDAGCALYNEAILVTAVGSLPIRAGRQFAIGRKLGKTHQNVLCFVKGDGRAAADACGPVDVTDALNAVPTDDPADVSDPDNPDNWDAPE